MLRFAAILCLALAPCADPPIATGPTPPDERKGDPATQKKFNPPPIGDPTRGEGRFTSKPEVSQEAGECIEPKNTSRCFQERCDHMITLTSSCEATVDCELATDVDPGWIKVHLEPGQFQEVTTRHGADDKEFEVKLKCEYYY
jgi:hypothetical protein